MPLVGSSKAIVLADMLSDSIKYQNQRSAKLICDPKFIPINKKIGSKRIENPYIQFRQITNQPAH